MTIKNVSILLLSLLLFSDLALAEQEVVIVQTMRVKPYEQALKGFRSVCSSEISRIVVSELEEPDVVRRIFRIRPDLVLAIGQDALSRVRAIEDIPIVYLMVLNPHSVLSGEKNITGVSMNIPEDEQLTALLHALPHTKTVGLLYDPARTGPIVQRVQAVAREKGVSVIAKKIHNEREAPSRIMEMKGRIDVFWMLPDVTVLTPQTVEFLLLFSLENKVPLLTFSEQYVDLGAFMSIGIDAFDMGSQAGEMANKILSGKDVSGLARAYARRAIVTTNVMIAGKLGIPLNLAGDLRTPMRGNLVRDALKLN